MTQFASLQVDTQRPLIATAIHHGHLMRNELLPYLAIDEATRLREEDPYTGCWTRIADTRVVMMRSRFEVDLNRPPEKAIYQQPEDAWGLRVWKSPLPVGCVERSREEYDLFYSTIENLCAEFLERHPRIVVFDLHSYNHRRNGPGGEIADPDENPVINVGTGTLDRDRWGDVVDAFINRTRECDDPDGRPLDVRENVKFFGGHFPDWLHQRFPENVCALAIEVKKVFMNEWTGAPNPVQLRRIGAALAHAADGVLAQLERN